MNFVVSLADTQTGGSTGGTITMLLMIVVMFVAFYFFGIRPQKKQEREANNMRNNLTVGD